MHYIQINVMLQIEYDFKQFTIGRVKRKKIEAVSRKQVLLWVRFGKLGLL